MLTRLTQRSGFTLIEMSIVLVVIGLIVGGILTGRDLIRAAEVRATITQIEKYNTAANTFRGKYGYLPGDIKDPDASNFGFGPRGLYAGDGDGNGVIEGCGSPGTPGLNYGFYAGNGETVLFWVDLTTAHLIEDSFNTATWNNPFADVPAANLSAWFPLSKIGQGNYVYVWSGGPDVTQNGGHNNNGINYFGLSAVTGIGAGGWITSSVSLTVQQAFAIDKKMDDGLPQSGHVTAMYVPSFWVGTVDTSATPGSATTCYDNGNAAGAIQQYSMQQNGGAGVNCALSFQFQ